MEIVKSLRESDKVKVDRDKLKLISKLSIFYKINDDTYIIYRYKYNRFKHFLNGLFTVIVSILCILFTILIIPLQFILGGLIFVYEHLGAFLPLLSSLKESIKDTIPLVLIKVRK